MYEVLEDGRVALEPTAPNDRIALSVYADLLRQDQEKLDEMSGNEPELNELELLLRKTSTARVHHIIAGEPNDKMLRYLEATKDHCEWVKVVIKEVDTTN